MNKKQVGAFLKVISKDKTRPVLCSAYIDMYNDEVHMVATDGYILSAIKMDEDAKELVGRMVRREAIERWYKLATGKSRFTGEELMAISSEDYAMNNGYLEGNYPEWQKLVPTGEKEKQDSMAFNAEFFKIIQDVNGEAGVTVELYGKLAPMVVRTDKGLHMVMPMKSK